MNRSRHVTVTIDLDLVRRNALEVRRRTGVGLIAVVKADAYGLGAKRVAEALEGVADDFACFSLAEAREVGRPGIVIGPPEGDPAEYAELGLRPAVSNRADARHFAGVACVVSVDSGMQRFGCDPGEAPALLDLCSSREIMTHASDLAGAELLRGIAPERRLRRHAACSTLLPEPRAWLDAVRCGFALYRGSLRVGTRLHDVRSTHGPAGYTRFESPHVGIILAGYSSGLMRAPVIINGRPQRVLEVGMNSAFVSVDPRDRAGDECVLLGDGVDEAALSRHFDMREHEVLCRYAAFGTRQYLPVRSATEPAMSVVTASVRQPVV